MSRLYGSGRFRIRGIAFCEQLEANKKSFQVFSDTSQTSSVVAGGSTTLLLLSDSFGGCEKNNWNLAAAFSIKKSEENSVFKNRF